MIVDNDIKLYEATVEEHQRALRASKPSDEWRHKRKLAVAQEVLRMLRVYRRTIAETDERIEHPVVTQDDLDEIERRTDIAWTKSEGTSEPLYFAECSQIEHALREPRGKILCPHCKQVVPSGAGWEPEEDDGDLVQTETTHECGARLVATND